MHQGRESRGISAPKQEPRNRSVDPGFTAQIGNVVGDARAVEPMYEGKNGPQAPQSENKIHPCGSQGKHR